MALQGQHRPVGHPLTVGHRPNRSVRLLSNDDRLRILRTCLTETPDALAYRVAAVILLLYTQPLVRIVRLTTDQVECSPTGSFIRFGVDRAHVPEPFAALLLTVMLHDDEIATLAADHAGLPIGRLTVSMARFEVVLRWPAPRWTASNVAASCDRCDQLTVGRCPRSGDEMGHGRPVGGTSTGIVTVRVLRDATEGTTTSRRGVAG